MDPYEASDMTNDSSDESHQASISEAERDEDNAPDICDRLDSDTESDSPGMPTEEEDVLVDEGEEENEEDDMLADEEDGGKVEDDMLVVEALGGKRSWERVIHSKKLP